MARTDKKMTENPIVQRITALLEKQGKTEMGLTDYLGLPPGSMSKWKYYGSDIYLKHIEKICEYLDTTPNYLFLGNENEEMYSPWEKEMIRTYRGLDERKKKCIRDLLKCFIESNSNED